MNAIFEWAENIIIFLLITSIFTNLASGTKFKKYVKFFCSIVLIFIIAEPIMNVFSYSETFSEKVGRYMDIFEKGDSKTEYFSELDSDKYIADEYLQYVKKETKLMLERNGFYAEVKEAEIDLSLSESSFIKNINLTVYREKPVRIIKDDNKTIYIEKIEIESLSGNSAVEVSKDNSDSNDEAIKNRIKSLINDFYKVNPDNINITIREGKDGE